AIDKPIAGFLQDLKQRGLLKDTLVASSTEFGRSSTEDGPGGRTHNAKAFASWLAGGGVKGGQAYGSTDELGSAAVENKAPDRRVGRAAGEVDLRLSSFGETKPGACFTTRPVFNLQIVSSEKFGEHS
ncbi:MAG: DUF1501 domain-containing protein, partial [Verrucomicrobia bacterium]|nr:DUF1501 domain-containing protein [Verrucomicrobiota bacterium]